jgi:methyl-accepting chemotaxis protein
MENIKIGPRLLLGFGAVVLLTVVLGIYSLERYSGLETLTSTIDGRDFAALQSIQNLIRAEDQMRSSREQVLLSAFMRKDRMESESPEAAQRRWFQLREQNAKLLAELDASLAQWESVAVTPQRALGFRRIRTSLGEAAKALSAIGPQGEAMFAAINAGNLAEAASRNKAAERVATTYEARLTESQGAVQQQIQLGRAEVTTAAQETQRSVIFVLLFSTAVGLLMAWVIHRSIVRPLHEFSGIVERVGKGDLTQKVNLNRRDELGELGTRLDGMTKGLKTVALQTREVAENLNSATAEILASTQQQAAGTTEQAAAVQEANATMAEISQSGAQISDRAKQVAAAAEAASSASVVGMQSVRTTVSLMESIREQAEAVAENVVTLSDKTQAVNEIVTTVNEISEQSHLLAVNAAIQAAVAGEHGRGFAVVANEMKNLAAQSKQATVQVRSILGDIQKGINTSVMLTEEAVKRVESGRQQAGVAERTIQELTENIEESIRAFQQIVAGSSQQQIGFEQVTQAFRNIGVASQQTANSTKQLEKAAANLSTLAGQLREAVERYRL